MIRAYLPDDLEAIVAMVGKRETMQPAEIQERLENWTSLVWEEGGVVKGVACLEKEDEGEYNLRVFVDPPARRAGIGSALYEAAFDRIVALDEADAAPGRKRVTVRYRLDGEDASAFFRKRGFVYWYSMDVLSYSGPRMPDIALPDGVEILPYSAEHYEDFLRVMAESFIPQRRFFDFRPHDVRELHTEVDDRERMLKNKENMFVLTERGKVVAVTELENNLIDTLGTDVACRGRGFGRALMHHCMNVLRDRGHNVVETAVLLGNMPAWRLYNVLGFKRVQIAEWACKWI